MAGRKATTEQEHTDQGKSRQSSDLQKQVDAIRKGLGHVAVPWEPAYWLNTGSADVNTVFGHVENGLPYGRIMEISGLESNGKTGLALNLAALAQQDDALVIWGDFENSYTEEWASLRGLDPAGVALISPYVGKFGKSHEERVVCGEELCEEVEQVIRKLHGKYRKKLLVVDSITSIQPSSVMQAGVSGQSMHTNLALATFMNRLLRQWVSLAQTHNVMMVFVNQLRQKPGVMFGDGYYTPGGMAAQFYSHVRVRLRRAGPKSGALTKAGRQIGIQGIIKNKKNKAGGLENSEIGYRLWYSGEMEFVSVKEVKAKEGA